MGSQIGNVGLPVRIRVSILDARELHRAALACLLNHRNELDLIGVATDIKHAEHIVVTQRPDVIVIGIEQVIDQLPAIVASLNRARPEMGVLLLSGSESVDFATRALEMGARGVVLESNSPEILVRAIRRVHEGDIWVDQRTTARMLSRVLRRGPVAAPGVRALTRRELEIIETVATGLSNRDVSEKLFISDATVRNHLTSVFRKLEVRSRMELIVYAYRHGLSTPLTLHAEAQSASDLVAPTDAQDISHTKS